MDLELDFDRIGYEEKSVAKDFAFVVKDGKTLAVFPSGTSHKVAIVEITNGYLTSQKIVPRYVTFNDDEFIPGRAPHGRYRQVEWAVGTNYVWVSDGSLEEVYIIDVMKEEVVNTISGTDPGRLVSVQNYEIEHQMEMQKQVVSSMMKDDNNSIEIAAIIIGTLAIVVGFANFTYLIKMRNDFKAEISSTEPKKLIDIEGADTKSTDGLNSIN